MDLSNSTKGVPSSHSCPKVSSYMMTPLQNFSKPGAVNKSERSALRLRGGDDFNLPQPQEKNELLRNPHHLDCR